MGEFLVLKSADEARAILREFSPVGVEEVPLVEADGRVAARDLVCPADEPPWPRATMDGYAVRAKDTFGASDAVPAFLTVVGSVPMGDVFPGAIGPGQAVQISTGGVVPEGADAVVMVEYTQRGAGDELEVHKGVAPHQNLIRPGEDMRRGERLVARGRRLRPQDIGALANVGLVEVPVYRRPVVGILSTGNEIVPASATPRPGQVRDVNQFTLGAQARRAGAEVVLAGIAPDDPAEIRRRAAELLERCDLVLLSGGSSIGVRDLTASVFEALGAEIVFHGISVRPGKPTIYARRGDKPIFGMPGVPVSAMVIFDVFVRSVVWQLGGESGREPWPVRRRALLTRRLPSIAGREDYVRVRLVPPGGPGGRVAAGELPGAEPLLGGSASLSTLVKADGLVVVPSHSEGIAEGEEVEVLLFE